MSALPRSTPESQGVASADLETFLSRIAPHEVHSLMLLRHGRVIAEGWWAPFSADDPHVLYSLSKSFAATAVGFAVHEGLLDIESTVVSLLPEAVPDLVSRNLAALRVRHLLTMTTGNAADTMSPITKTDTDWARDILAQPIDHAPGTHFVYNSGATYLLSAIMQRVTGQRLLDYLTPRLLDPLGIAGATWETCPRGIDIGGWGLSILTEDIAAFGQLMLQEGRWGDAQLVPAEWVRAATSAQVDNRDLAEPLKWQTDDWMQGYGYQFWRCTHNAYRADGAFGQFAIGMPEQDALLVVTSGMSDTAAFLATVWDTLLPALSGSATLDDDAQAQGSLLTTLAALALPTPAGEPASTPVGSTPTGSARWSLPENDAGVTELAITVAAGDTSIALVHVDGRKVTVNLGAGVASGRWALGGGPSRAGGWAVAAAGDWRNGDILALRIQFHETPYALNLTVRVHAERRRRHSPWRRMCRSSTRTAGWSPADGRRHPGMTERGDGY